MDKIHKILHRALDITAITLAAIFSWVVIANVGHSQSAPRGEQIPFNSMLFFGLFAAPILLSLAVAIGFFAVQQYRASNGTRNRGWEEQW